MSKTISATSRALIAFGLACTAVSAGVIHASPLDGELQRKTSFATCTNQNDPGESFSLGISIVRAPHSVQLTVLRMLDREFRSSGEYQPEGQVYLTDNFASGQDRTLLFVSWDILKGADGFLEINPFEKDKQSYFCKLYAVQG